MEMRHLVAYGALSVLNAMLAALAMQLGAGKVPIPAEWQFLVPILTAGLTALCALLPRYQKVVAEESE